VRKQKPATRFTSETSCTRDRRKTSERAAPRAAAGAIRLTETVGEDVYPRYAADLKSMTLF